jgi:SAM-dependent methyltransferase
MTATSSVNPGSFMPRAPLRGRAVLARAARALRSGHMRHAVVGAVVDSINLLQCGVGKHLAPRVRCPCCGGSGRGFLHLHNERRIAWSSACPQCDSRSRHRGLAVFLPRLAPMLRRGARILHFAPEQVLHATIQRLEGAVYETADLIVTDVTHSGEDLQKLSFGDGAYDLILCNHVLEHIEADDTAVAELARVLSDDGIAVITIPGDFARRRTIVFPNNSLNGHYRDYGMEVVDLFGRSFGTVEAIDLHALDRDHDGYSRGIRRGETAFVLWKRRRSGHTTLA